MLYYLNKGAEKLLSLWINMVPSRFVMGQPWRTRSRNTYCYATIATWDQSFESAIGDRKI